MDALSEADGLIIMIECTAYRSPDFPAIKSVLSSPVIFVGRNLYDPSEMMRNGFTYFGVGRRGA
ncbi:hypothetical protein [Curvibacter sp. CHRR-16]|uniref:hypothetical protein n=1 Tax=Curvibacter sp. CHRR-16 TaxID=2835872 RepID=UPI002023A909|nr:hypothetical protein [Curvibacter sp. CHRR-16]